MLLVFFMVAFEQYTLAVAVRSALAPLAVFALHGDAVAAGAARFGCIFVGVCIGAAFLLAVNRAAGPPASLTARRSGLRRCARRSATCDSRRRRSTRIRPATLKRAAKFYGAKALVELTVRPRDQSVAVRVTRRPRAGARAARVRASRTSAPRTRSPQSGQK